jgi:hypothetical protein
MGRSYLFTFVFFFPFGLVSLFWDTFCHFNQSFFISETIMYLEAKYPSFCSSSKRSLFIVEADVPPLIFDYRFASSDVGNDNKVANYHSDGTQASDATLMNGATCSDNTGWSSSQSAMSLVDLPPFQGKLDDISFYDHALSQAEVLSLLNPQTKVPTVSPTPTPTAAPSYAYTGGDSTPCSNDPSQFAAVKYYYFEDEFDKTLGDDGGTEEYRLQGGARIQLTSDGWLVKPNGIDFTCSHRTSDGLDMKNYSGNDCNPPENTENPNYQCQFLRSGVSNTNWFYIVPTTEFPSTFSLNIATKEQDGGDWDGGSTISWSSATNSLSGLTLNTDVWAVDCRSLF